MTFDPELKIWDVTTEADFDGWQLRYVESLPVDRDDRACITTVKTSFVMIGSVEVFWTRFPNSAGRHRGKCLCIG